MAASRSGPILMLLACVVGQGRARTDHRRGGFWRWRRFMRGASRTEVARIGGVTLQIVRDWVLKFNADGPAGLIDRKAPGQPPRLNDAHPSHPCRDHRERRV